MTHRTAFTIFDKRGIAHLNTTIAGRRFKPSLGILYSAPAREVEAAAKAKYAELVSGRALKPAGRVVAAWTLDELGFAFVESSKVSYPKSWKLREIHALHFVDTAATLSALASDNGPNDYAAARLKKVTRQTVKKELSTLFAFFEGCVREGHLTGLPPRAKLPTSSAGTRSGPQREAPVAITHDEALAIIDALPELAARGGRALTFRAAKAFRCRDMVRFAYETGLKAKFYGVERHRTQRPTRKLARDSRWRVQRHRELR